MTIREIKCRMFVWKDYYGNNLAEKQLIVNAKTRKQLRQIIKDHIYLKLQNVTARSQAEKFIMFLELN